jgi:hypothetical protein
VLASREPPGIGSRLREYSLSVRACRDAGVLTWPQRGSKLTTEAPARAFRVGSGGEA